MNVLMCCAEKILMGKNFGGKKNFDEEKISVGKNSDEKFSSRKILLREKKDKNSFDADNECDDNSDTEYLIN